MGLKETEAGDRRTRQAANLPGTDLHSLTQDNPRVPLAPSLPSGTWQEDGWAPRPHAHQFSAALCPPRPRKCRQCGFEDRSN